PRREAPGPQTGGEGSSEGRFPVGGRRRQISEERGEGRLDSPGDRRRRGEHDDRALQPGGSGDREHGHRRTLCRRRKENQKGFVARTGEERNFRRLEFGRRRRRRRGAGRVEYDPLDYRGGRRASPDSGLEAPSVIFTSKKENAHVFIQPSPALPSEQTRDRKS